MNETGDHPSANAGQAEERARLAAQKKRNMWLALALFAFVVIVGVTTVIRLGDADLSKDGGIYWRNDPQPREQAPMPELPSDNDADSDEGPV